MSRRKAREVAFKMLFQMSEGANEWEMAQLTLGEAELSAGAADYASQLSFGAWEHRFEIAEYIRKFITGWQLERLFSVDRELLHLAIYELKYGSEPQAVVINEAVELAKMYGRDESPAFVNAVLDNFCAKVLKENLPEYQPDEAAIEQARAAEQARMERLVPEPEPQEEPRVVPRMPITEKMEKRGFRKIAKAEQTEQDVILPEPDEEEDEFGRPIFRRDGDRKFAERKPYEKRDGERKFGDRKPYEKRDGDRKSGDKKFGDKKPFNKDRAFNKERSFKKDSFKKDSFKKDSFKKDR